MEDRRLRLLAHSAHAGPVDDVRRDTILQRAAPAAVAARLDALGVRNAREPVRLPAAPELGMAARVCFPLRGPHGLLGFAWVIDDPPLADTEADQLALGLADVTAALVAAEAGDDARGEREQALVDALLGPGTPAGRQGAAAAAIATGAFPAAGRVRVLAADDPSDLLTVRRRSGAAQVVAGTFDGLAVALIAGDLPPALAPTGTIGAGEPVASLADVATSHREAVVAHRVARAVPALGPVAHFGALGPYGLLAPLVLPGGGAAPVPRPAALTALEGEPNGPELLFTLRALLDAAGDVTLTARRLHLHRATLYRRLRRIETLTGADLADGLQRLHLHAALLLDDLR